MAGTTFGEVYDLFMQYITDYKLVALYNASVTDFETYLSAWLKSAITDFKNCNQSLTYATGEFTVTLTEENIKILALLMKKYWLAKEIENVNQMNLHVQDKDFKTFAESNNLKEKRETLESDIEKLSQTLVDYGLGNATLWENFYNGVFYVP